MSIITKLAPTLRSKLCFTEIFAHAFTYEKSLVILRSLCKSGQAFIDANKNQIRSFCYSDDVEKLVMAFGENAV